MSAYYSEIDPGAAEWLRELIRAGEISPGIVDERDIRDVAADDIRGHERVHLFSGIAGWELALRLAGWPAGRPVWTGSCPCQPYSSAGKGLGDADPRNLWPEMLRLIRECRPDVVFGEQVEGAVRHGWLDRVCADLEGEGYAVGAVVLGAHSAGAPHIRQRLYWVADSGLISQRRYAGHREGDEAGGLGIEKRPGKEDSHSSGCGSDGRLAHSRGVGRSGDQRREGQGCEPVASGGGILGDPIGERLGRHSGAALGAEAEGPGERVEPGVSRVEPRLPSSACELVHPEEYRREQRRAESDGPDVGPASPHNYWSDYEIIPCRDGKSRRTQPGIFPLAHGVSGRVGLLRGYGNSICPQTAAAFIRAFLDTE